ncbi:hypothetical protein LPJ66_000195 [Kickxella alabastrina]|uniref:Uncharacterized protein n=1 Tax=Kickxella alabastrina TaxID=61397 RepID=A0ACC1IWR7_9FUNG|nr:hypothetical protein LPJ66_000195 [Kickxella alabastrina]
MHFLTISSLIFLLSASSSLAAPFSFVFGHGLIDPLTGSGQRTQGESSMGAMGNSFLRVDQDTRMVGQRVVGLVQNSVDAPKGPAIEGNGIAAVFVE